MELKGAQKLRLSADGFSAENWGPYKVHVEHLLAGRQVEKIYLNQLLSNTRSGTKPRSVTATKEEWLAGGSDAADYDALVDKMEAWEQADMVAHGLIMSTLPEELMEDAAQRPSAPELWDYLASRFSSSSNLSVALLNNQLFTCDLADFPNVAAWLTAINKLDRDIKKGGGEVPTTTMVGAVLKGMGLAYPETKTWFINLPSPEQTKEKLVEGILKAEKNAHLDSAIHALAASKLIPKHAAVSRVAAPAGFSGTSGTPCHYIRQLPGKREDQKPGERCTRVHKGKASCWMKLDDQWLKQNPGASPNQLPYWGGPQQRRVVSAKVAQADTHDQYLFPADDVTAAVITVNSSFYAEYLCPKVPHTQETIVLDNGAAESCFKAGNNIKPLPRPVPVSGACKGNRTLVTHSSTLPCPALGEHGSVTGLYSSDFNHNLLSVRALQRKGVEVVFPAYKDTAECRTATGQVSMLFRVAPSGLYEAKVKGSNHRDSVVAVASTAPTIHPTTLLHQRLGHPGDQYLQTLIKHQGITGLPPTYNPPPSPHASSCLPCIQAKAHCASHPLQDRREAQALATIHVDLVGPLEASIKGHRYWLTVVDDHSRHGWSYPLRTKDQAGQQLQYWIQEQERQTGQLVKKLHCDRGTEFLNDRQRTYLTQRGIQLYTSNPYTPQQNGIAEARNKTVGRIMRLLRLHSAAPYSLWCFALPHATHLANLLPHRLLEGHTPAEAFTKTKPSLKRLKVWGCTGHVLLNKAEQRKAGGKLGPRTKACVYLGVNPEGPGYLLWDAIGHTLVHSSDVVF